MVRSNLEKVLKERVEPLVDDAMQKFLGVRISEIGRDISDSIERNPLISYDVNTSVSFKVSKKLFKKEFLTRLIRNHLGNVSAVAKITGMDRRSIHRAVKELGINIKQTRKDLISTTVYQKEAVDGILKNTLDSYKSIIRPARLEEVYKHSKEISSGIVSQLPPVEMSWKQAEKEFEKLYLDKVLKENKGNISKTAKKIGLRFETLHRKLKKLGL